MFYYFTLMPEPKYPLPSYLTEMIDQDGFNKWLDKKSWSLLQRDKRRPCQATFATEGIVRFGYSR
jgi:hypothetical protein